MKERKKEKERKAAKKREGGKLGEKVKWKQEKSLGSIQKVKNKDEHGIDANGGMQC